MDYLSEATHVKDYLNYKIISVSKYNAHTDPIFKQQSLVLVNIMLTQTQSLNK